MTISVYVQGNVAAIDLDEGSKVRIPKNFGVVRDPIGKHLNRCDVYLCAYKISSKPLGTIPQGIAKVVAAYWSADTELVRVTVEIPKGPWHRLGVVETIHYVRYDADHKEDVPEDKKRSGPFWHDFDGSEGPWIYTFSDRDPTVVLYESRCMHAFKLDLPDGCIINDRGFVWP